MGVRKYMKIDEDLIDKLQALQAKLPKHAPKDGHSTPAGLALLGHKNKLIDYAFLLHMDGGCWDAPTVGANSMSKGLAHMIEKDRIVCGMALIRNESYRSVNKDKISNDMRSNILHMRGSFEDIEQTVWLVITESYVRIYKPKYDQTKRLRIVEQTSLSMIYRPKARKEVTSQLLLKRIEKANKIKEEREKRRKVRQINVSVLPVISGRKEKLLTIPERIARGEESIIRFDSNYAFVRNQTGEYVLCPM